MQALAAKETFQMMRLHCSSPPPPLLWALTTGKRGGNISAPKFKIVRVANSQKFVARNLADAQTASLVVNFAGGVGEQLNLCYPHIVRTDGKCPSRDGQFSSVKHVPFPWPGLWCLGTTGFRVANSTSLSRETRRPQKPPVLITWSRVKLAGVTRTLRA